MPDESKVEVTTTTVSVGSSTGFSPFAYARTEWEILKNSKTVKGLIAMEAAAIGVFVEQVFSGDQKITIAALQGWFCVQAALIVAFLLRQAFAGLESQNDGRIDPAFVKKIETVIQDRVVKTLEVKGHPSAAAALSDAFKKET